MAQEDVELGRFRHRNDLLRVGRQRRDWRQDFRGRWRRISNTVLRTEQSPAARGHAACGIARIEFPF